MKKLKVLLIVVFFLTGILSLQQVTAQEKSKEEQEKEIQMQQTIELQKKAMADQKKAQEEALKIYKEQSVVVDEALLKDLQEEGDLQEGEGVRFYNRRGGRTYSFEEPFVFSAPSMEYFSGHSFGSDSERTTWDFSKTVKENTFSRDYTFDVEKTVKTVVMTVNGDCKAGEIRIKIIMPNGKNYSDIVIDEFGNLNWRKSFTITETENQDKTGDWKFQISSTKATGFFKISLQTY